jgi:GNAT superfamily N-acetyltransferase
MDMNMAEAQIRLMTRDDFALLAAWMVEVPLFIQYRLTPEKAIANFQEAMDRGDWLLTADAEIPACGFAWVMPKGVFGRSPYMRLIGVNPEVQRWGIGASLLNAAEKLAENVSNDMFLLVSDFNTDARRFYRKHGYTQIGAVESYVIPSVTELIFRKQLK